MSSQKSCLIYPLAGFIFLLGAAYLLLGHAMSRGLNHDEHQFLGPATLISRQHLRPYRDFPLFHLPNLTYLYAAVDPFPGDLMLKGKLLNSAASIGLLGLFFLIAWRAKELPPQHRFLIFAGASGLLLCDPLFLYSSGKTWNHELPALLLTLAVYFHLESFRRRPLLNPTLSGACLGLATGTRLTYVTLAAAFVLHLVFSPGDWKGRVKRAAWWLAGFAMALAPCWYFLATSPDNFIFDNLRFPRLRLLDAENARIHKTVDWTRKLRFLFKEVLIRSWPLLAGYLLTLGLPRRTAPDQRGAHLPTFFLLALFFCLAGCFAPSRYQYQHYYALAVLLALAYLYQGLALPARLQTTLATGSAVLLAVSLTGVNVRQNGDGKVAGWKGYLGSSVLLHPEQWQSSRLVRQHARLQSLLAPHSKILTLGPTAVVQVGLDVYPEFGTGVFAWRSASLLSAEKRAKLHFAAPEDLDGLFAKAPPAAILTGVEDDEEEKGIIAFAESHGYRANSLGHGETLWLPSESPSR